MSIKPSDCKLFRKELIDTGLIQNLGMNGINSQLLLQWEEGKVLKLEVGGAWCPDELKQSVAIFLAGYYSDCGFHCRVTGDGYLVFSGIYVEKDVESLVTNGGD